ncbi:MAG: 2-amino-4-hydroxy-6-hydroxymethyldihydropteridine diphosphokinase [Candidatus Omnitrophica bacterium]|nr:2-amino-4-hydroxy-6-hydroxymethyldihydropteridine diphosphokinase [Candidatus Omnitrophota bacterium]
MVTCYLGIGSNLGKRRKNIELAVRKINSLKDTQVLKLSRIIESSPIGGPLNQREFLNAALKIRTELGPLSLLKNLKIIERQIGRKRTVRFGPRPIDLDVLFYGERVLNNRKLTIPHPRIFERKFVTRPLLEIL